MPSRESGTAVQFSGKNASSIYIPFRAKVISTGLLHASENGLVLYHTPSIVQIGWMGAAQLAATTINKIKVVVFIF